MQTKTRRILIHGFYGAGNLGDDAILESMVDQMRRLPGVESITVSVYGNRDAYSGAYPVRVVPGRDTDRLFRAIEQCDVVVVGGGGLLQDYHGFKVSDLLDKPLGSQAKRSALGYYGLPLVIARILGRPTMLYAVGLGPFRSAEAAHAAGWLAQSVSAITVRDQASAQLLRELGHDGAVVTADPAVSLSAGLAEDSPDPSGGAAIRSDGRALVGINLRPWSFARDVGDRAFTLARDTAYWLAEHGRARVLLLPLNLSRTEVDLARELAESLPEGSVEIRSDVRSPAGMLALCRELDLVIGMRLHASILSMTAGTPAIGLAYDQKVTGFFVEAGVPELCVDVREATLRTLQDMVDGVLEERETWRERIHGGIQVLRRREQDNLRIFSHVAGVSGTCGTCGTCGGNVRDG